MQETFATLFFRIYDRKIASGEITFGRLGMDKNHFTNMCTDKSFVPPIEAVEKLCVTMKLTGDETKMLIDAAQRGHGKSK